MTYIFGALGAWLEFLFAWLLSYFDTWLGFIGLLAGFVMAGIFGWRPFRTAAGGYVCGVVLVVLINLMAKEAPACLERSKGADILRAYRTTCVEPGTFMRELAEKRACKIEAAGGGKCDLKELEAEQLRRR
jgi:hypothetical protein